MPLLLRPASASCISPRMKSRKSPELLGLRAAFQHDVDKPSGGASQAGGGAEAWGPWQGLAPTFERLW
eukprot:15453029-Alexandrium_andersonii.AAC.1